MIDTDMAANLNRLMISPPSSYLINGKLGRASQTSAAASPENDGATQLHWSSKDVLLAAAVLLDEAQMRRVSPE